MHGDAVESRPRGAEQPPELRGGADRRHARDRQALERPEQPLAPRGHRDPPRRRERSDGVGDELAEAAPRSLQVEQQLRRGRGGREQVGEQELRSPPARELPAIPEHRHRPERLQVAHFETAAVEPDVGLDDVRCGRLRGAQQVETVTRAMRDDERRAPPGRVSGGFHWPRV